MSREFLVWFEPAADALFALILTMCICSFILSLVCILIAAAADDRELKSESRMILRLVAIILIFTTLLSGILVAAVNPFTDGPKLYDTTHKTLQQAEKALPKPLQ